jgi:hypothetical protein
MKITEQTTLAELQAYLGTVDGPELAVTRKRQSCMGHGKPCAHAYHAVAYFRAGKTHNGGGDTIASAIEDALGSLRSALGVTNLAYEPLNYVSERPCHGCDRAASEHPNDSGCQFWHAGPS